MALEVSVSVRVFFLFCFLDYLKVEGKLSLGDLKRLASFHF